MLWLSGSILYACSHIKRPLSCLIPGGPFRIDLNTAIKFSGLDFLVITRLSVNK